MVVLSAAAWVAATTIEAGAASAQTCSTTGIVEKRLPEPPEPPPAPPPTRTLIVLDRSSSMFATCDQVCKNSKRTCMADCKAKRKDGLMWDVARAALDEMVANAPGEVYVLPFPALDAEGAQICAKDPAGVGPLTALDGPEAIDELWRQWGAIPSGATGPGGKTSPVKCAWKHAQRIVDDWIAGTTEGGREVRHDAVFALLSDNWQTQESIAKKANKKARKLHEKAQRVAAEIERIGDATCELVAGTFCRYRYEAIHPPIAPEPPPNVETTPTTTTITATSPLAVAVERDGEWACSGVVVQGSGQRRSPAVAVLTARHCLPATRVLLGADVLHPLQVIDVVSATEHPDPTVDVAILWLAETPLVPAVARRSAADDLPPYTLLRAVGFGARDPYGVHGAGDLHAVDLPGTGWRCDGADVEQFACEPTHELVVLGNGGSDTCTGDSGGPLLELLPDCKYRLVGITSRTVGEGGFCGDGGIYTRVDTIADWLDGQLEGESP